MNMNVEQQVHATNLGVRVSRRIAGAALLFTGLTLSGFAAASEVPRATVQFERGELASAEGLQDVHDRVTRAAASACRLQGVRGVARLRWESECREEMTRELLAAIDSERLLQFHAQRSARDASAGA